MITFIAEVLKKIGRLRPRGARLFSEGNAPKVVKRLMSFSKMGKN